jgi:hypothetical protein
MTQPDNKDTYGVALGEIRSDVKHLIVAVNQSREDQKEHKTEIKEALNSQDKRITRVEQFQWKMAGIIGFLSVVIPIALTVLLKSNG